MCVYKKGIDLNWGWDEKMVEGFRSELSEEVTLMRSSERGVGVRENGVGYGGWGVVFSSPEKTMCENRKRGRGNCKYYGVWNSRGREA